MSALAGEAAELRARAHREIPLLAAIVPALAGAALLTLPRARAVWNAGEFYDSDDAMRAVQLRDLLAGQSWFDMTARRLDPPDGLFMHWSRIVDTPLAALDLLFGLFLAPEMAERATRLAFPFLCLALLFALAAFVARVFADRSARFAAIWLVLLSAPMFVQFTPGRIDHHAPQILLLMATFGLVALGLHPKRPLALAAAAAPLALSLAISLENIPFFIVALATPAILFLVEGKTAARRLLSFALGLLVFAPLTFAATVAPSRYGLSACDAYSAVHIRAVLVGALGFAALAAAAPRLDTLPRRIVGLGLVGAAALGAFLASAPHCLGDPLVALDPLLRDLWLSHVTEAKPLKAFVSDPALLVSTAAPVLLGLLAATVLAWRERGLARGRWAMLAAAILIGFAAALWQIRVFSSVTPLAMVALAGAAAVLSARLAGVTPLLRWLTIGLLCLFVSPMGLALALQSDGEAAPRETRRACLEASAFSGLAALPPARIVAPVDMGAHLLAFTPHHVFAAPYHRDNHGNRLAVETFLAAPAEAERLLRAAGAELLLWCDGGETGNALIERAPNGLAAALARGESLSFLEKIPLERSPFHVFALRPAQ
ncbi:hypothetical protein FM996_10170 [Methylosinus sporium]|uniref:Glycosyltransferase RgtA/B/C/D-like domain-containing protein n=1 Tax=Methylosinus sporium TaxID=428 RepID=A0A549SW88_METSR|nr:MULTISPECIES: hypothetical protein [Methylosinus]MBU3888442.1 hypothetical protein [Methylosinus sp. KRF6]TRL33896.1 hypothetical protein FM996_10170 [Methylosinus sporium]